MSVLALAHGGTDTRGHQVRDGRPGVGASDQGLADQDRVRAVVGVGDQVLRAAHRGGRDLDDVIRDRRGDLGEGVPVDVEGLQVAGVDADDACGPVVPVGTTGARAYAGPQSQMSLPS